MTITQTLTSPLVIGGTMVLIGLHQFNLLPFFNKSEFGSMKFTIPVINMAVTPLAVLGVVAVASGALVLSGRSDFMTPNQFVSLSAEMHEGAKAWGH